MLYKNNGKIYLRVSEFFIEVDIKRDKNDFTVIPKKSNKISVYGNQDKFVQISIEKAYEIINKKKSEYKLNNENLDENK